MERSAAWQGETLGGGHTDSDHDDYRDIEGSIFKRRNLAMVDKAQLIGPYQVVHYFNRDPYCFLLKGIRSSI